jgi:hypothetical protein
MGGLRIALGILNLIACVCMLVLLLIMCGWARSALVVFTWGLPFIIAAILALIGGIYSLRGKRLAWAISGLITAVAVGFYFFVIAWIRSWIMI